MEQRSRKIQYLATICLSLAFVALGATSAWPSPVIPKFKRNETNVEITDTGISWMVSMNPVGFIVGSFIARYTSDRLGRRMTVLASAPLQAVGSILAVFGLKGWMLCITLFLWSCSTGMLSTVTGIYLAEIAEKDLRATLSLITRSAFTIGNLLVMAIGPSLSYETLNSLLLPLPFIYLIACWWVPETPYYLLKEGKVDEAKKALKKLRGYRNEKSLEEELTAMQAGVKSEMSHSTTALELFSGKQYRRAVIVAAGIKFTQIMTGGTCIKQYLGEIMIESRLDKKHEQTVFIIFGVITSVVSMVSSFLVDRMGRRSLLISSYLGTGLSLAITGVYFFLLKVIRVDHESLTTYGFIPFAAITLSSVISTFGFVALSSVIPAEIFPLNVKCVAMTSLSIFGGVLGFFVGKGYQNIKNLLDLYGVFWIFAFVAFFGAVFTYFVVPETGGKNLTDIQKELQGDAYDDDVAKRLNEVVSKENKMQDGSNDDDGTEMEELTKDQK